MSASGYTPIQLYYSSTATNVPSASNLISGELAINIADEKLYFKNASGTVKLLAYSGSTGATVSSVNASGGTTGLTFSGGPITTSGTLTLGGTLAVTNGGTGLTTLTSNYLYKGAGTSALVQSLVYDNGTNVGIGTSSPSYKLDVSGTGRATSDFRAPYFYDSTNTSYYVQPSGTSVLNSVGIGTSSPGYSLDVVSSDTTNGNALRLRSNSTTTSAGLQFTNNAASAQNAVINVTDSGSFNIEADGASSLMIFRTNGVERMRINSGGYVLIGTSSAYDTVSYCSLQNYGGIAVKMPGTSPSTQMSFFNDNGRVGYIGTSGTSTTYYTSSDIRLKHDIVDAPSSSALIDAIKVRSFKWNADESEQRYGFIAQELYEVVPEAVGGEPDGKDMMAVDYSKLVPMLVKEIQSLRARVAQLERK